MLDFASAPAFRDAVVSTDAMKGASESRRPRGILSTQEQEGNTKTERQSLRKVQEEGNGRLSAARGSVALGRSDRHRQAWKEQDSIQGEIEATGTRKNWRRVFFVVHPEALALGVDARFHFEGRHASLARTNKISDNAPSGPTSNRRGQSFQFVK